MFVSTFFKTLMAGVLSVALSISAFAVDSVRNDVVQAQAETSVQLVHGDLLIDDINQPSDDTITLSRKGAALRVRDPKNVLFAAPGTVQIDAFTVDVPYEAVTGVIRINTGAGDDLVTLDLSEGSVFPPGGIFYDGGSNGAVGDALAIHGGDQGVVTYRYDSPNDGTIDMSNYGRVTYMGLEPLVNTGTASDVIFVLPATANIATLTDDGTASNGLTRLSGANFELTDFSNPTGSITILRGNSADTLTIGALPDLTASITIGTAATPFSALMFSGAVTLATDKNLTAFASGLITLNTTSSALATSGVGSISLTTATNILVSTSASIKTVNGALSLSANQTTSTAGNFTGIDIDGGLVQASGTGSVSVLGKGGTNAAGNQRGVRLINSADIVGGTAGTVTVTGTGGLSTGTANYGVYLSDAGTTITSGGAAVNVTGVAGGSTATSTNNYGLCVFNSAQLFAGGSGTTTVSGTAGPNTSARGTYISNSGLVSSSGGAVSVTGIKGSTNTSIGIIMDGGGQITDGNSGSVTLIGDSMTLTGSISETRTVL